MSEYSNVISGMFGSDPATNVTANVDVDPDKTARAYELSKATGVPVPIINTDVDSFETQSKAAMASQIVGKNSYIMDYVNSHPLASSISNDDYGNLDATSEKLQPFVKSSNPIARFLNAPSRLLDPFAEGAIRGAKEGYGDQPMYDWLPTKDLEEHPFVSAAAATVGTVPEIVLRSLNAAFRGSTEGVKDQVKATAQFFGADENHAEQFSNEMAGMLEAHLMQQDGFHEVRVADRAARTEANATGVGNLTEAVKEAQTSTTRERAPELFQSFVEQHTQNATMGVSGQRVLELYGDKIPEADDGLLGFIPNLKEQLEATKETGADITVPLSDWITKADPAIHKELADDLRIAPDGITAREAAEDIPAAPTIPEPVPALRNATALEPLFSVGDRKLQLQRMAAKVGTMFGPEQGFHDFDMVNENGQTVGSVNLSQQGKQIYIEMVNGIGEYYNPNNFGPSLMRDLFRQIFAEFPDAEVITGHRVSGARGQAGTYNEPHAMMTIRRGQVVPKLSREDFANDIGGSAEKFSQLLGGAWHSLYEPWGLEGYIKRSENLTPEEHEKINRVEEKLNRIAPAAVSAPIVDFRQHTGGPIHGAYISFQHNDPLIAWALNGPHSERTILHEGVHHLIRTGRIRSEELTILQKAGQSEGWLKTHDIESRYPDLSERGQLEEAIADAFPKWDEEHEIRKQDPNYQPTPADKIFQKIKDMLEAIREHLKGVFGREPTFEDIFERISSGEIGRRAVDGADVAEPALSVGEPGQGTDVRMPFRNAKDVGMTVDQYQRYQKLIEARQAADLAKSEARAIREQTKRQTDEWKAKSEAMRPQVAKDIASRPDVAADNFLGLGELFGKKMDKHYKLDEAALTPEQKAVLPDRYYVKKGGLHPDELASVFGYQSGDQMVDAVGAYHSARELTGKNRDRYERDLVNAEIQRRMEMEHGFLEQNIMEEAKDQVLSQNQLDLLHEETHALVQMAGEKGFDLTQGDLTAQIKAKFDALPMRAIDSEKWLREAGKQGKNAELALLQGKPSDAFKAKQTQYYNTIYANFARQIEKDRAKLEKAAKAFRKTEVKGIEPEYLNHIQNLLQQAGFKVGRSLENIQENLQRRGATLEEFADAKLSESFGYRDIPVADFITDGKLKAVDDLSTWEFKGFKQTFDALVKNGKDEQKIYKEGATADRKAVLDEMKDYVRRFELKPINATPTRWDKIKEIPRSWIAGMTSIETFLNRLGDRDPLSVFNRYITYPAAAAANRKAALQREFAKAYRDIGEIEDKNKLVASPLTDPLSGQPLARFTRGNVMQMLQNAGNESNWTTLAKGYGADPEALMGWLVANTKPKDWARAQRLGTEVFGKLVKLADQEYEHLNGVTIDKIPLKPITNAHGTFEGWYHPLIHDPIREGKSPIKGGAYDDSDFGHISTSNGYTRKRSGAAYPLDLNPDMTPVRINQMIHDISFRSFVLETQKLFKDSELSNVITSHYGAEYNAKAFLMPWLRGVAGQESVPSKAAGMASHLSEFLRQNVISTYIGFNPFTALKHGPTAAVMSVRQVGLKPFAQAVADLYGRSPSLTQANHEFVMKWSEELQRRERYWIDTIFGAHRVIEGARGFRENIIEKGSWLVAKSDMLSAKPTWLAAYRNAQERGLTHGDSIDLADAAVRQAHGSTAVTNQPALVRGGGALHSWLTSVYGFFGTNMQRRIELAQDINDTFKQFKQGEITAAAGNIPSIATDVFTYVIWPTLVEEWVTGITADDKRGWGEHLATATALGLSSSILYARDMVHGLISGNDPGVGLISSFLHDEVKAVREVGKPSSYTKARAGKTVGDTLAAFGHLTGMAPKSVDNAIHFGIDLVNQQAHPRSAGDWFRGVTRGETKARVEK